MFLINDFKVFEWLCIEILIIVSVIYVWEFLFGKILWVFFFGCLYR